MNTARLHLHKAASEAEYRGRIAYDTMISEPIRTQALQLAKGLWAQEARKRSTRLNDESWNVVKQTGGEAAAYRDALHKAEEACQLQPGVADYLNTLGVAQYRTERYPEALATLTRSNDLNKERTTQRPRVPGDGTTSAWSNPERVADHATSLETDGCGRM